MSVFSSAPDGLTRILFRAPLWLYRLHLGWLLGHRFARLTHRGRRSGQVHQSVVEVLRFDPRTSELVVASGWGGRTDWYRNIQRLPALEVRTGGVSFRPAQRFLTTDQLCAEVRGYGHRHPWIARLLFPRLFGIPVDAPEPALRDRIEASLRGVAFQPDTNVGMTGHPSAQSRGLDRGDGPDRPAVG